jgi:hypothetical protein
MMMTGVKILGLFLLTSIQNITIRTLQNDIRKRWWTFAINPDRFDKLTIALRTAVDNDGTPDNESTIFIFGYICYLL